MEYSQFEHIMSAKRMKRYLEAMNNDTKKAMALYRYNLKLSQEMFTIVSCFEVALRNAIDRQLVPSLGTEWLKDSISSNGIFDIPRLEESRHIISKAYNRLVHNSSYSHSKLIAELEFESGNICFLRDNIGLRDNAYCEYFLTSQNLLLKFNITTHISLMNWIK